MNSDPMAVVALADHLLRTCGMAMRTGGGTDPAPLFEMLHGLGQMPADLSDNASMQRARQLLDGGGLALSGLPQASRIAIDQLPSIQAEISGAIAKGDEPLARSLAAPFLGTLLTLAQRPELPPVDDESMLAGWLDAVARIRQARWGDA